MLLRGASKKLIFMSLTPSHPPFSLLSPRSSSLRLSRLCLSTISSHRSRRSSYTNRSRLTISVRASEGIHTQTGIKEDYTESSSSSSVGLSVNPTVPHQWPEWTKLLESLRAGGYFDREVRPAVGDVDGANADAFEVFEDLPGEFMRAVNACLLFARDRTDLLRFLSKKDIEVLVENGSAFLFKNGMNSTRRLRAFLVNDGSNVLEFEKAQTVDVMRFLLSNAYSPLVASDQNNRNNRELVEASMRNLLSELVGLSGSVRESGFIESMPRQFPTGYGQSPRPVGQNIEMKRGDWICTKCSFMNFARNMKCLECNEVRPKRLLTGGEWECPQCDFFNYGRNTVCLRCDCKRPGETTFGAPTTRPSFGFDEKSNTEQALNGTDPDKRDIESRLAANEEKAQRWFSKISQLDSTADMSSAIADEDFPEIMPLRKGVNRFVVSTRKTPLERRLANAQYRRNLGNDGSAEGNDFPAGDVGRVGSDQTSETSINQSLDRILGRSSAEKNDGLSATGTEPRSAPLQNRQPIGNQGSDSGYVPFVPLPADMFAKPQKPGTEDQNANSKYSVAAKAVERAVPVSEKPENHTQIDKEKEQVDKEKEQAEKSERWFKKVAELHDVTDLASAISDEDFPEIMPMRKGENRFVVSKKKDRSLTSPQYKRRQAMEQANNSNFVPFVPFPPDYFAKNKNTETQPSTEKSSSETTVSSTPEKILDTPEKAEGSNWGTVGSSAPRSENQQKNGENWNVGLSPNNLSESKGDAVYGGASGNSTQRPGNLQTSGGESWNSGRATQQQPESRLSSGESWNRGFTGKSLEGSMVKEPDPLDMSEEAKAERWFRRVAQIKDISELSQIPDEDFPSIMPMRKGVNRFVVSKRKTPLERRLTSPQYRRNLPIVSSSPTDNTDDRSDKEAAS
ncbi:zinc finger protein VAR3, chloroplastic [Magnolia sinica]|uniref:zinc finger protein VAR3, chloroplastic n=1 Tax=Magnolia sinica TaxID=86752 RepID=UPI0026588133|nr:zinc finger protein VAR3, chloroplastic [Magnolia sinica]